MLTHEQKAAKLREAIALLMDVDNLQQAALGDSDVCYANHNKLQELIEDLAEDCEDLERRALGEIL